MEREKKKDRGDFMQTLDFREIVQLLIYEMNG